MAIASTLLDNLAIVFGHYKRDICTVSLRMKLVAKKAKTAHHGLAFLPVTKSCIKFGNVHI